MSLSYQPLKVAAVEDNITHLPELYYAVLKSGTTINYRPTTTQSISSSSIIFNVIPPSSNIIIDRLQTLTLPIRLSMTGTITTTNGSFTPGCTLLNAGFDAPRAFPLSNALETLSISINGTNTSVNLSDVLAPLVRYNSGPGIRSREWSQTPNYPDCSNNYGDLVGTTRNPLGNYGDSDVDGINHRGGFPFIIVSNPVVNATTGGAAATAVVDFVITEPMFLSPWYFSSARGDDRGFYNVTSIDFNFNFLSAAPYRMWSHAADAPIATSGSIKVFSAITQMSVQFNAFANPAFSYTQSVPQINLKYITPSVLNPLRQDIPYTYSYFDVQRWPYELGTLAYTSDAASGTQYTNSNVQLSQIPRRVYLYAKPSNLVLNTRCDITDTFLAIQNVNINFNNRSGILSAASQQQLYQINVKNHYEGSWAEFSGMGLQNSAFLGTSGNALYSAGGAPLCLEFGTDIELDASEAPGLGGQFNFNVQIQLANKNPSGLWDNIPFTLFMVFVYEGTFTVTSQASAQSQINVLAKSDVLNAQAMPSLNYRSLQGVSGGSFLDSLSNFGNKIYDFLRNSKVISSVASAIPHPVSQAIAQSAQRVGLGYDGGCDGGLVVGGARRRPAARRPARRF